MNVLTLIRSLVVVVVALVATQSHSADRVLVFAPSSMTDVLRDIEKEFEVNGNVDLVFSLAGSAQLARQLDGGAPADVYISANSDWMDWVQKRRLIQNASRSILAGNRLVLAVRKEVENWADIDTLMTEIRFAMAEPDSVPAGTYARQALQKRGIWEQAKKKAVYGENVRITLRRLALGEVGAAIVYATDVAVEPAVRALFVFPSKSHSPISYQVASTVKSSASTKAFLAFLQGELAQEIFVRAGFIAARDLKNGGQ